MVINVGLDVSYYNIRGGKLGKLLARKLCITDEGDFPFILLPFSVMHACRPCPLLANGSTRGTGSRTCPDYRMWLSATKSKESSRTYVNVMRHSELHVTYAWINNPVGSISCKDFFKTKTGWSGANTPCWCSVRISAEAPAIHTGVSRGFPQSL
jgi:hypothetical protein